MEQEQVMLTRDDWEAVIFALRLYMEQDECVCEVCVVGCEGCMYCIASTAITNAGPSREEIT